MCEDCSVFGCLSFLFFLLHFTSPPPLEVVLCLHKAYLRYYNIIYVFKFMFLFRSSLFFYAWFPLRACMMMILNWIELENNNYLQYSSVTPLREDRWIRWMLKLSQLLMLIIKMNVTNELASSREYLHMISHWVVVEESQNFHFMLAFNCFTLIRWNIQLSLPF